MRIQISSNQNRILSKIKHHMFPAFNFNQLNVQNEPSFRISTQNNEKSFHIQRQTFYHNNFKKLKPSEFFLKQNHTLSTKNFLKPYTSYASYIGTINTNTINQSKLLTTLKSRKGEFEQQINKNFLQVNKSFNRYINQKTSQQQKLNNQKKRTISCKNLLKQLKQIQSVKKLNLPLVGIHQKKNLLEMATETNYEVANMESNCLDTLFPYERYGQAIASYQGELILYGGFTCSRKPLVSCFHKYNLEKKQWTKVQESSKALQMIPCFHTIDVYKNYMILVGGVSISPQNGKRKYNSDICIFNFQKKEWTRMRSSLVVRSHASTLFGNTLMIHGGVNEKENNSNQMHFINFNHQSMQNSILLSTENISTSTNYHSHALSHQKLINTNEVDSNLKALLKYDGVLCFGGVNNDGIMHNDLTFLNCIGKENALDVRFQSWLTVELMSDGPIPQARKNHTFNIINKKALILLVGGQNSLGEILNDMWIFDLIKLQWKQVNPISRTVNDIFSELRLNKLSKFIERVSGHCCTFMGSRLFIFGGRSQAENKKQHCLWSIETDLVGTLSKKLKIEKSVYNSVNTIKDSTKEESMWNIQF